MRTLNRTSTLIFCWLAAFSLTVPRTATAENWPGFRGPSRQGISNEKNLPIQWSATSNIVWRTAIPGEGWSSPIVFGDRIFVSTATEEGASYHLLCLDRKTGAILWDRQVLRQKPGHRQPLNSYASSTPVTDGKNVYIVAFDGSIAAVSMKGDTAWMYRDFEYFSEHGLGVSPILYKDLLIVAFDPSSSGPDPMLGWQKPWDRAVILALDKNTGKVRWEGKRGLSQIAHVSPQILNVNGKDQLISSAGNVIQGFDPDSGERIWTVSSPGEGVVPSVVVGEDLIFTASGFGDSTIRVVRAGGKGDVTKMNIAWESTQDVPKIPSMLYVKPYLYLVTETGVAKCFKAATGEVIWRERLGGGFSASPVWADGKIYFLSDKGITTVIADGSEFKVLSKNELNETCKASPAISQGNIFIRSDKHLYCIGKE
jgi:outer membrane protein assembly factor BamB